jgi:sulfur-carrier protein
MTAARETPRVHIVLAPALLRLFPGANARVDISAASGADAITALDARWPGMGPMLRDERPAIRRHINVFVGGVRATLETRLEPDIEVTIFTAVSGG